ncbi:MAG TPA: TatA/E family twin arginine-targeting protein translocase [Bryobacteraceae bacterium]|jgi:sec-independent protein translocase protein TatA
MGTLGVPEMMVIFLLALVLFGPKKLPELGRTLGKALTEFRRASSDLKSSFEREMQSLERESDSLKEATHSTVRDLAKHFDYSDSSYDEDRYHTPAVTHETSVTTNPSTVGALEASSVESHGTTETTGAAIAALPPVEDTVPRSESTETVQKQS